MSGTSLTQSVIWRSLACSELVIPLVFGIFFTAIMVLIAVSSVEAWRAFYVFLAMVESVIIV